MDAKLEKYVLQAHKLGFNVRFSKSIPWIYGHVSFYPSKRITIGTRTYNGNSPNYCGLGEISEHVQALILSHEIGHILTYQALYPHMRIEEYCLLSDDAHFKIIQEVYAWKVVLSDKELTIKELEFIQEQINEYIWYEHIGAIIVDAQCELSQKLIDGLELNDKKIVEN